MIAAVAYREERWGHGDTARSSSGDIFTVARSGGARRHWNGWSLFIVAGFFVLPWGLFIMAVIPEPATGHHDTTFVVFSLIYALVLTPMGVCALWPGTHGTGYVDAGDGEGWNP